MYCILPSVPMTPVTVPSCGMSHLFEHKVVQACRAVQQQRRQEDVEEGLPRVDAAQPQRHAVAEAAQVDAEGRQLAQRALAGGRNAHEKGTTRCVVGKEQPLSTGKGLTDASSHAEIAWGPSCPAAYGIKTGSTHCEAAQPVEYLTAEQLRGCCCCCCCCSQATRCLPAHLPPAPTPPTGGRTPRMPPAAPRQQTARHRTQTREPGRSCSCLTGIAQKQIGVLGVKRGREAVVADSEALPRGPRFRSLRAECLAIA